MSLVPACLLVPVSALEPLMLTTGPPTYLDGLLGGAQRKNGWPRGLVG